MLYFVVRTDATAQDGVQRVFGVWDTQSEAERFLVDLQVHMRGEFAVYVGEPVPA